MLLLNRNTFFWTQFVLLLIGISGIFPSWVYSIPVLIGISVLFYSMTAKRNTADSVVIFFTAFLLFLFIRSTYNNLLFTNEFLIDLGVILFNFGMLFYLRQYEISSKGIQNIIILFYGIAFILSLVLLLGINSQEAVSYVFKNSSHHLITWISLLLFGLCVRSKPSSFSHLSILFVVTSILLGGRTGIFVSLFILVAGIFISIDSKKNNWLTKLIFVVLITLLYYLFYSGFNIFGDVGIRGFALGPREFVWACYFENLNTTNFFLGFSKNELNDCTMMFVNRSTMESSWFNLQSLTGFGSIILSAILLRYISILFSNNKALFVIILALIFRATTGEFLFVSPFDWLFLLLVFPKNHKIITLKSNKIINV